MATRYSRLNYNWATDSFSQVVDPDDDVDHPSGEGGPGKYLKGWEAETEPQEWENYILKRFEDIELQKLQNGWELYQSTVNYQFGAIAIYNGVPQMFISVVDIVNPIIHEDGVDTLYSEYMDYLKQEGPETFADEDWTPVLAYTKAAYDGITQGMFSQHNTHVGTPLAHSETIAQIGGYTKSQIDGLLSPIVTTTNNHVNNKSNPHVETAIGVGTLPALGGGNFTGRINYLNGFKVGSQGELMYNSDKIILARDNDGGIGLGTSDYRLGGKWQMLLSADTYIDARNLYNGLFTLPVRDISIPLKFDLSSTANITYSRSGTLAYTDRSGNAQVAQPNVPAFELKGLKLNANTTITIDIPDMLGATQCTIAYVLNDVLFVRDMHLLSDSLTYYFGNTGNVRNFQVWINRLTPRQKLNIQT
jgi:hypothetical protein